MIDRELCYRLINQLRNRRLAVKGEVKPICQVRLTVDVHKQHLFSSEGKPCGNVDCRGGFRHTAFFIGNADDGWFFVLFHLILSFQKTKAIRLKYFG